LFFVAYTTSKERGEDYKMKSIKTQLIAIVTAIIGFVLLSVITIAYWNTANLLQSNLEEKFQVQVQQLANGFDIHMQKEKTIMESFGKQGLVQFPLILGDTEKQIQFVQRMHNDFPQWNPVTFFPDVIGKAVTTSLGTMVDASQLAYVKRIAAGKSFLEEPIVSVANGKAIVVGASPISINGKVVGAMAGGIPLEGFTKEIDEAKIGQAGYGILVTPKGMIVSHPNKDFIMKKTLNDLDNPSLLQAMNDINNGKSGHITTVISDIEYLIAYAPTQDGWGVFAVIPTVEEFATVVKLKWIFTGLFIISMLVVFFAVNILGNRIAAPLREMVGYIQKVSEGDFTKETLLAMNKSKYNPKDEIGQLDLTMKEMREKLWGMLKQVSQATEQMASSSIQLKAGAEASASAANQIAVSVTNVAAGAEHQVDVVNQNAATVEQMAASSQEIVVHTSEVAALSQKAAITAKDGSQGIQNAVTQMSNIEKTVMESSKVVTKLGDRSKEIGQIVDTIAGIAGQTNLLALNAAIEAARAGEQGKGFAVVAEEVRKLAEQSQEAAKRIAGLIGEIQSETDKAVTAMKDGTHEVKRGSEIVDSTGQAFQQIVVLIEQVSERMHTVLTATQQMAGGSQDVATAMREMTTIHAENSSEIQTVSAATQEQSASMEEIAASCDSLSQLAKELRGSLEKFQI